jgi:hypothetical protein
METVANDTGSVVSSVLLGALAASSALPFPRELYERRYERAQWPCKPILPASTQVLRNP